MSRKVLLSLNANLQGKPIEDPHLCSSLGLQLIVGLVAVRPAVMGQGSGERPGQSGLIRRPGPLARSCDTRCVSPAVPSAPAVQRAPVQYGGRSVAGTAGHGGTGCSQPSLAPATRSPTTSQQTTYIKSL